MAWPQAVVFAWMAISGLLEIAMINANLDQVRKVEEIRRSASAGVQKMLEREDIDLAACHETFVQTSLNIESNAKWKAVAFTMRVFAVRLVILVALHSGGFF